MVRDKHEENSSDAKEGENGFEAMISSFGLYEGLNQNKIALRNTANKSKMEFLVFGMEILLAQPNVSLIKLVFSSTEIALVLFIK